MRLTTAEKLIGNDAFVEGNKRAAITAVGLFLQLNGYRLTATNQELEDFTLSAPGTWCPKIK